MFRVSRFHLFLFLFILKSVSADHQEKRKPKVAIVGAGAAGIAAASVFLETSDLDVEIFEAEQRYGGRIFNLYEDNYYKALGAEWTPANDENIVYEMLTEVRAFNEHWTPKPGIYAKSNGAPLTFDQLQPYIDALNNNTNDLCSNITSEDEFYQRAFMSLPNNEFDETLGRNLPKFMNVSIHFPCDWDEKGSHIDKPLTGDPKQPTRGMKTVLDVLMNTYPSTEVPEKWKKILKLGHKVTKISWNHGEPEIFAKLTNGTEIHRKVDHVIVTIPIGALKANHLTLFEPTLPDKHQKVINALSVGIENNIYLTFENRWWPTGNDLFVIWTKADVQKLERSDAWLSKIEGFVPVDDAPAVLAVHNMELEDSSSEKLSDEEVIDKIMSVLRRAFGSRGWNITNPTQVDHSRWGTNPNFYGSVTYKDIKAFNANVTNSDLSEEVRNEEGTVVMLFAGEATHDRFAGSVHGAVETGFNAAKKLVEMYENR